MKITWVNHASFVLEHEDVRLLCDPWLDGHVFDNSWSLLSPTTFSYADFARITHIWFSHEHPDHFFPPNLKNIPSEFRRNITVLFQPTRERDRRVLRFCRSLGFRDVIEIPADWTPLGTNVLVYCQPVSRGDSWLAIRAGGKTMLNLNDCIYMEEDDLWEIQAELGPIDVLLTQFSYASWWGNPEETDKWRGAAADQLAKIGREINVFQPESTVLSASFVYFCHEENVSMNRFINRISDAHEFVESREGTRAVVLYPGDEWVPSAEHDNDAALQRYQADYESAMRDPVKVRSAAVPIDALLKAGNSFIKTLGRLNSRLLLGRMKPALIHIRDHDVSMRLDHHGLKMLKGIPFDVHDISASSSALQYALRFPWGGETLMINGRFYAPAAGNRSNFFRWTGVAQANNRAVYYDRAYYVDKALALGRRIVRLRASADRSKRHEQHAVSR